ncbi:MAG: T9SS type A sorting domain-containing protein [Brumimicrobium sp.]|nr:T9SS type A sorting domain-containing protein [Brumimicrobium sp.]
MKKRVHFIVVLGIIFYSFFSFGQVNFTESSSAFQGVGFGSVAMGDLNGDGFPDVVTTGADSDGIPSTILYLNDGAGNYYPYANANFENLQRSAVALVDFDNDGDLDVIIAGVDELYFDFPTRVYLNKSELGYLGFESVTNLGIYNPLMDVVIAFEDFDNDGYIDVILSGEDNNSSYFTTVYRNNVNGYLNNSQPMFQSITYSLDTYDNGELITYSAVNGDIAIADIDNDGDNDIIITGIKGLYPMNEPGTALFLNEFSSTGLVNFTYVPGMPFPDLIASSVTVEDVDSDGISDVFLTGISNTGDTLSLLYYNNGNYGFSTTKANAFEGMSSAAVNFADIDGDGDIDIIVSGFRTGDNPGTSVLKTDMYLNDGDGEYTMVAGTGLGGASGAGGTSMACADIDGDGDIDIIISGIKTDDGDYETTLYLNETPQTSNIISYDKSAWLIYPNPSTGVFTVNTSDNLDNSLIEVYSVVGELVYSTKVNGTTATIDLEAFANGVYTVKLNQQKTTKIVKY